MRAIVFILSLSFYCVGNAEIRDLPRGHELVKNETGDYSLKNSEGEIMFPARIIKLGWNNDWIVACVENESIDTDLKRFMFINLKMGGASDTINLENWNYFKEVYPALGQVELTNLTEEDCPKK